MERELRFLVWKVQENIMEKPFAWADRVGIIQSAKEPVKCATGSTWVFYSDDPELHIWLQFTGANDRHGTQIYDRFIVEDNTTKISRSLREWLSGIMTGYNGSFHTNQIGCLLRAFTIPR